VNAFPDGAAQCFVEMGSQGTGIADVARRQGDTEGRVVPVPPSEHDFLSMFAARSG